MYMNTLSFICHNAYFCYIQHIVFSSIFTHTYYIYNIYIYILHESYALAYERQRLQNRLHLPYALQAHFQSVNSNDIPRLSLPEVLKAVCRPFGACHCCSKRGHVD